MESKQVKIGQIWARKDGRRVKVIEQHKDQFQLKPLDGGRIGWKWDRAIQLDMTFVSEE